MKYFDRIKDTTTTAGTGNITVSGTAQSGFRTFSAVLTTADTFYYCIDGGTEWETGIGTMVSTNVFSRSVKESSNSDALVPFSAGTKTVFVTAAADFFTGLPGVYDPYGSAATVSGALSTHAGLTTSAHGGIVASSDSRLTDARTPTAHKTSHSTGQSDALAPSDIGALALSGGTLTGGVVGHVGTDYTTARLRNVIFGTADPTTEGNNGDIYIKYTA